jgi:hypothetical protein
MKKKATTRKVTVRNSRFMAAMQESVATRTARHARIADQVKSSGVVETLVKVNKKKVSND